MTRIRVANTNATRISVANDSYYTYVSNNAPTRVRVANDAFTTYISPKGPGPDPWLEPAQEITVQGDVEIDYSLGKHCIVHVAGQITNLTVINWPASGRIARLTLEFINEGSYGIDNWDLAYLWPEGIMADLTPMPGGRDRIILSTTTGGQVVYCDSIGFDYRTV